MLTATRGGCRSRSPLPPSVEATDRPHPVINFLHGQASVVVGLHPFAGTWFRPENHLGVVGGDDIGECATNVGACIGVFQQRHAQHGIPGEDVLPLALGLGMDASLIAYVVHRLLSWACAVSALGGAAGEWRPSADPA